MSETNKPVIDKHKKQYEEKLKISIKALFNQLKSGCDRKICFNKENCRKAIGFNYDLISKLNDKDLLTQCIKQVQATENLDTLLCIDFNKYAYSSSFVKSFDDWYYILCDEQNLKFCPYKALSLAARIIEKEDFEIYNEIISFNSVINQIYKDYLVDVFINLKEQDEMNYDRHVSLLEHKITQEHKLQLSQYLFNLYFNFVNFIFVINKFYYNEKYKKDITIFFENFSMLIIHIKKLLKLNIYKPPKEEYFSKLFLIYAKDKFCNNLFDKNESNIYLNSKSVTEQKGNGGPSSIQFFSDCIVNFQNFLTVLVLELTQEHVDPTKDDLKVLVGVLRLFELFYWANKSLGLVDKSLFENEKVNNYLSLKYQCDSYFKYHHNKLNDSLNVFDKEVDAFSFIKYHFLYDSASKKDIITLYNSRLQQKSILSSIMENIDLLSGPYLVLKVKRNDLVKSTLDLVSGNLDFKKPLKVSYS